MSKSWSRRTRESRPDREKAALVKSNGKKGIRDLQRLARKHDVDLVDCRDGYFRVETPYSIGRYNPWAEVAQFEVSPGVFRKTRSIQPRQFFRRLFAREGRDTHQDHRSILTDDYVP